MISSRLDEFRRLKETVQGAISFVESRLEKLAHAIDSKHPNTQSFYADMRQLDLRKNLLEQAIAVANSTIEQLEFMADNVSLYYLMSFHSKKRKPRTFGEYLSDYADLINRCLQRAGSSGDLIARTNCDLTDHIRFNGLNEFVKNFSLTSLGISPMVVPETPPASSSSNSCLLSTLEATSPPPPPPQPPSKPTTKSVSSTKSKSSNRPALVKTNSQSNAATEIVPLSAAASQPPSLLRSVSDASTRKRTSTPIERPLEVDKKSMMVGAVVNQLDETLELKEEVILDTCEIDIEDLCEFYVSVKQRQSLYENLEKLIMALMPKMTRVEEIDEKDIQIGEKKKEN